MNIKKTPVMQMAGVFVFFFCAVAANSLRYSILSARLLLSSRFSNIAYLR